MSRWFRLDDDVVNDPKVQRLPGEKFKAWVNLLCIASKHGGVLPPISDVAFILRISVEKASALLDEFCSVGLLDPVEVDNAPMSYEPHNWKERQFKSDIKDETAAERMRRYRDKKRNERNAAVTVTPTRTETEQIQIQKEHCTDAKASRTKLEYSEEFETKFWLPYPRSPTMAKKEAWREWMKLTPDLRSAACQAIEPYKKYLRSKPNLETVHACRFLSQQRFDGFVSGDAQPQSMPDIRSSLV